MNFKDTPTLELYAGTLDVQARLHANETQEIIQSLGIWNSVHSVLDAGCGAGSFQKYLSARLKDKSYTGIDREGLFIQEASERTKDVTGVRFLQKDLFEFREEKFDLIYVWAVLQHLPSVKVALQHFSTLLNPGGGILIFDTNQSQEMKFEPNVPSVVKLFADLEAGSQNACRNEKCLDDVIASAPSAGFTVVKSIPSNLKINSPTDRRLLIEYVLRAAELIERFYSIQSDRELVLSELNAWDQSKSPTVNWGGAGWLWLKKTT